MRRGGDTGSATVWMLTLCAVVLFTASAVVLVTAVRVDRHRAATAADLAALAGAARVGEGASSACAQARRIAVANEATLIRCRLANDLSLHVTVHIRTRAWPGSVAAHARAGPRRSSWSVGGPGSVEGPGPPIAGASRSRESWMNGSSHRPDSVEGTGRHREPGSTSPP
ncbi:Rv3654c family TadE-like protein [Streptomonospora litoralis]|uniref:Rv3654c family TadE-like protein n=1 Tax=Streptomonospora litoralis TaxID=2498135 RepID=UPI001035EF51|nr:Rv3654c family TadE-like protein [Streptomonospora litoralis]